MGLNIFCPQPYSRKNLSLPVLPLAFCSPMLVKLCLTRLTRAPCAPPSLFGPRDGANRHPSSCLGLLTVITSNFGARSRVSPPGGYALQKAPPVALGRIPLWRTAPSGSATSHKSFRAEVAHRDEARRRTYYHVVDVVDVMATLASRMFFTVMATRRLHSTCWPWHRVSFVVSIT